MIYLGTVNWRYPHWVNSFYPMDDDSQWLSYYAKQSSFAEIRTTYSRILPSEIVNHWAINTSDNFIFAASMNKQVTYDKNNEIHKEMITKFFDMLKPLGDKLGIVLLHFPKLLQYTQRNMEFISRIIDSCKEYFNGYFVVDVSNRSWYVDEVNEVLINKDACLLNSDRKPIGSSMSNPEFYYLKLAGDTRIIPKKEFGQLYFPREEDLKHWSNHLKFKSKRHKNIFVSIDNHYSGDSTKDAYLLSNTLTNMKIQINGFKSI
ncbi:MAG: DUF72 domain-containing protein [Candidatus Heimdallarchaeota archaeon]